MFKQTNEKWAVRLPCDWLPGGEHDGQQHDGQHTQSFAVAAAGSRQEVTATGHSGGDRLNLREFDLRFHKKHERLFRCHRFNYCVLSFHLLCCVCTATVSVGIYAVWVLTIIEEES
jgi:hypothetical protein